MKRQLLQIGLFLGAWLGAWAAVQAGVRIKDITDLEGAPSNRLQGVGLVVGLDGTGGKESSTQKMAVDMLQRFQINTAIVAGGPGTGVFKSNSISMVTVTATLGPFHRKGSRIDVTVATLDGASSLHGGELLLTPLKGADGVVYSTASGQVVVGGFNQSISSGSGAAGSSASVTKNHPTVGTINGGGEVVAEARGNILCKGQIRLLLRNQDYTTARTIAKAINQRYGDAAMALDMGTVQVFVPDEFEHELVGFVSALGQLEVSPDNAARVVVNARTGTVVAGENVKIARVAIAHGNLTMGASSEAVADQPNPLARGKTAILPRTQVEVAESPGKLQVLPPTISVAQLASALNALGATPRDLITIFQHLHAAKALHAELVIIGQ